MKAGELAERLREVEPETDVYSNGFLVAGFEPDGDHETAIKLTLDSGDPEDTVNPS